MDGMRLKQNVTRIECARIRYGLDCCTASVKLLRLVPPLNGVLEYIDGSTLSREQPVSVVYFRNPTFLLNMQSLLMTPCGQQA